MAMVAAPPAAAGGSQTAFTYSSEPQAVPPKRSSVRSKYREDAATTPDAAQWIDENDVGTPLGALLGEVVPRPDHDQTTSVGVLWHRWRRMFNYCAS